MDKLVPSFYNPILIGSDYVLYKNSIAKWYPMIINPNSSLLGITEKHAKIMRGGLICRLADVAFEPVSNSHEVDAVVIKVV